MTTFDLAMLTASPSPSPSPEALPLSATALVSLEESVETRITRTWRAICDQVCTLVLMVPDARNELIEEQESWMREWSSLLMSMTACGKDGAAAKVPLHMEGEDTTALASGRKSHCTLEKLVKSWKAKPILPAVEEPEVATACPIARVAEVVLPAAGSSSKAPAEEEEHVTPPDMGEPSVPAVPRCVRCVDGKLHCVGEKGKHCDACAHARKGCSFVPKRKAPAVPTAHATKAAKACESTVESTKHVATSTVGGDTDESSSSEAEVEIIGEHVAEEKVIRGSRTIPPRPIKPLPVHPTPAPLSKGKAKAVDTKEVLALALAENTDLKEEVAQLKEDWATVESKMAELLD
ncbi:hypothetical protein EV702DRAFT_1198436 [Suillus placidus]|uniref:Zn(2)-C6 fungal-type domain-containing protein n=1 Tax=Suillus placidus TaxID=48579 RepID=A0A9P7D0X9_9AGAM|nr:hypothetical protein EV702DRAFT_1198436 [Suillus placidus]